MVRLHLMRSGETLPQGTGGHAGLCPVGRERLEREAHALLGLGLWFDLALCPQDPAAVQTARAVLEVLNDPGCRVATDQRFRASGSTDAVLEMLREDPSRSILLVSDAPLLPRLASRLLCGEKRPTPLVDLDLEPGGLLCLETEAGFQRKARLLWSLPPGVLAGPAWGRD